MEKVAVVTGVSRGIGKSIALELAKDGFVVIGSYYEKKEEAELVLDEINRYSSGFIFKVDVSKLNEVSDLYNFVVEKYDRLDVLVNNAGAIIRPGDYKSISDDDFDKTIGINLKGTFNCIKIFADLIRKSSNGRIINLASTVGRNGCVPVVAYSAAKAGIINLTRAFSKELAPNVTVNAIAPGNIDTDMTRSAGEDLVNWVIDNTPMKRLGNPEDVAYLVSFLASEKASFITGQIIDVAGGYDL